MGTSSQSLTIHLLGQVRITDRDGRILLRESERLQTLLAYLVLHADTPLSRGHLAYTFWPDSSERQARTNLRNLLHRLRQLLPQADAFIHADTNLIAWRPHGPFVCDALEFDAALDAAESCLQHGDLQEGEAALRRAVQLYRGDLLPGHYDEWLFPLRERFRQRAFRALEMLTRLLEERQEWGEAIRYSQAWLRLDPLNEEAYRCLMRLHTAQDNRAAALQTYHTCVTILQRELGVEPDEATQALYHHILRQEPRRPAESTARRPSPLIGRDEAWQRLVDTWRAVRQGQFPPQCVLITGEAGIGKSRLAEEFVQWAKRQRVTAATAHAPTPQGHLAFEPVAAWLRSLPPPSLPPAWQVEVARLLPDLLPDGSTQPSPLREAWQRQRFFEALTRAILSQPQPLLLLLDDAQWADQETLDWLHYLLRYDLQARLLLLLTARSEALTPEHPLPALTEALQERGQFTVIPLTRLDAPQTTALAAHLVGHALPEETAAALYRHTEGNPLFVVESVNSGLELIHQADAPLPNRVRGVLTARLRQLSREARALAEVAAVIGRAFTTDVLAAAAKIDEDRFVRSLDELWQRRLIHEQGPTAYEFSHDKLRQVTYEAIGPARRQALHRRVAEALVTTGGDGEGLAGLVAAHYEAAGLWAQAIPFYHRAAQAARSVYANAEAARLWQKVVELGQRVPLPAHDLAEAYEQLGETLALMGDQPAARRAFTVALTHVGETDPLREVTVWRRIASTWTEEHAYEEAWSAYRRGDAVLQRARAEDAPRWWRAWIDLQLHKIDLAYFQADMPRLKAYLQELEPAVARYGTPLQQVAYHRSMALWLCRRERYVLSETCVAHTRRALELVRQVGDTMQVADETFGLGFCLLWHGDLAGAEIHLKEALHEAQRLGNVQLQIRSLTYFTILHRLRGEVERVRALADQGLALARADHNPMYIAAAQANLAWVAWRRGEKDDALRLATAALETWKPIAYPFKWLARWPRIAGLVAQQDVEAAIHDVEALGEESQQRLPSAIAEPVDDALKAWAQEDRLAARRALQQALDHARTLGHL